MGLPAFMEGHRHYMTISIDVQVEQHRSVYMVDRLKQAH